MAFELRAVFWVAEDLMDWFAKTCQIILGHMHYLPSNHARSSTEYSWGNRYVLDYEASLGSERGC